MLGVKGLLAYS